MMNTSDIIRLQIREKGYCYMIDGIVDYSRPIDENIKSLYTVMDLMVSYILGDIVAYLQQLVEAINMTKDQTDEETNGIKSQLLNLIASANNDTQSILDNAMTNMFDDDIRIKRISATLDLTHTMLPIIAKARKLKLNCELEKYVMDGLGTLDGVSRRQSDLLSGKFEKFKKGGE